jgi:Protein of unknown function (DUF3050)
MASFFYGRENVIPDMFKSLLDQWGLSVAQAPGFVYYLQRHIQLDGDSHGPAAGRMIEVELARTANGLQDSREAALQALLARRALWDGTATMLRERYAPGGQAAVEPVSPAEQNLMRRIGELRPEIVAAVTP